MNGSRTTPPRAGAGLGERSSLDALNRTIEGLEARIEGLIGTPGRDQRPRPAADRETIRRESVSEIVQRQRALQAAREPLGRDAEPDARTPQRRAEREPAFAQHFRDPQPAPREPQRDVRGAGDMTDIAESLVSLRHDLKKEIAEGVNREMAALRAEIRSLKADAGDQNFPDEVRSDLQKLADSINQLGRQASPAHADALRVELDGLRSVIDGLAREDSVKRIETRWTGVEDRLKIFDRNRDDELLALAHRLDDIKTQIGSLNSASAIVGVEDKLISVAKAIEMLGRQMRPDERLDSQFADLDARLDEISRAIVASGRTPGAAEAATGRLEDRLVGLSRQIDALAAPADTLTPRIEALAARVEELASEKAAVVRLEERIAQLSVALEQSRAHEMPDLDAHLSDISRKIEALDSGEVNAVLAERLDDLARRIDGFQPSQQPRLDDRRFERLEDRLQDIAIRLEEAHVAPVDDRDALRSLEAQIANLSSLVSQPRGDSAELTATFESRMSALEDYLATSDEYIIEAARQAAEAVMEAYSRNGALQAAGTADVAAIAGLADDLKALEAMSRSSEERTARTFEALHDTLVQIATKLEKLEEQGEQARIAEAGAVAERTLRGRRPSMPKASQPRFEDEDEDDFDTAPAAPVVRREAAAPSRSVADVEAKAGRTGLIAGLARRFSAKKEAASLDAARPAADPVPSIDPSLAMAPEEANQLLEPGSGVPDVKKILERVRAGQMARASAGASADADKADFIAAARRAAQNAAEEVDGNLRASRPGVPSAAGGVFARNRRPIMMAVGAILLVVMSLPLVNTLVRGDAAPDAPVAAISETVGETATDDADPAVAADETRAPDSAGETASALATPSPTPQAGTFETLEPTDGPVSEPAQETSAAVAPAGGIDAPAGDPAAAIEPLPEAPAAVAAPIEVPVGLGPEALVAAVKGGDPLAYFEVGARYTEGRGVKADPAEAAKWYQHAADSGFAPALYRLGNLYEKGTGVARDLPKAKAFYEEAAAKGNASAMHNLAVMYASGSVGAPDFAAAGTWFEKAAELGVRDSQFNLAILFARGNGVPQDLEQSYKWFAIAARDGDQDAAQKRDEVGQAMRPEQLTAAKKMFEDWKPAPVDSNANAAEVPDAWAGEPLKTASVDMKKAVRNIQAILNNNGFDAGRPDGQMGKKTVAAIKAFQTSIGQEPTGEITDALIKELLKRNS
ncbi:peptidoglycan-binding protein [Ensifer soli]|uniref:peptidoglycan-binding protein n=1 Tax=Ciceribacter sp. sgz301302 TaxID=3342379 RepID=UPI0035B9CFCF